MDADLCFLRRSYSEDKSMEEIMKRFLSVLLVLCTVLSLFPISFSAQAQTLAKDESGAEAVSDTALSNGAVLTKDDALYVGANGAKTANGGSLLGLYTAFGVDSSAVTPSKPFR